MKKWRFEEEIVAYNIYGSENRIVCENLYNKICTNDELKQAQNRTLSAPCVVREYIPKIPVYHNVAFLWSIGLLEYTKIGFCLILTFT